MEYFIDSNGRAFQTDIHGRRVERTRDEYPYSYDAHLILRFNPNEKGMRTTYSDRMRGWNYDLYHKAKKKYCPETLGDYWNGVKGENLQRFLRVYFRKRNLKLIGLEECCNVSNGYPIWIFYYVY